MDRSKIWAEVELELRRAKRQFPNWPDHPAAQAGIVNEEAGELMKAALEWKYQRGRSPDEQKVQQDAMIQEAIQTAAMAIRFLENL
jgi:hypothetical protein